MAQNELTVTEDSGTGDGSITVTKSSPMSFLHNNDLMRSVIIILILAIFLFVGIAVVYWGKSPNMRPLGSYNDSTELNAVISYLKQHQYQYQFYEIKDGKSNVVTVTTDDYDKVVEALTVGGIVNTNPKDGSEILLGDSSFGVSARKEEERLKYAREQQIANMLKNNRKIVDAKVLLAIPKRNVFARDIQKPSASVTLKIAGSGVLSTSEVDAIVDSVASSVQGLETSRVTVIDQNGRLLNSGSMDESAQQMKRVTELQNQKEADYKRKIEEILNPILGYGNYTPLVAVALDPISEETTSKTYSDNPLIRSENVSEEYSNSKFQGGVPGSVTNQPPANSQIPENIQNNMASGSLSGSNVNGNERRSALRNYELDTKVSHSSKKSGNLERLSVSVAINYKDSVDADGKTTQIPRTQEELDVIKELLSKGLGIDEARGDTIAVHTVKFYQEEFPEIEPEPFYKQDYFEKILRISVSAIIIITIVIFIVKPMIMNLINRKPDEGVALEDVDGEVALDGDDDLNLLVKNRGEQSPLFDISNGHITVPQLHKDEDLLMVVRTLVREEPDLSAQVIKSWLEKEGVK
ncbi:MAG: flagellar basal-body MS-ring/collar protein FliF [Succinivibrionaceae bacterium]